MAQLAMSRDRLDRLLSLLNTGGRLKGHKFEIPEEEQVTDLVETEPESEQEEILADTSEMTAEPEGESVEGETEEHEQDLEGEPAISELDQNPDEPDEIISDIRDEKIEVEEDEGSPETSQEQEYTIYKVTRGETLAGIANRHGVTQKAIMEINKISNPNHVMIGQRLRIPK